jgi:hypothetical protein
LPWPAGDTWGFHLNNGILYACDMGLYSSTDMGDTWELLYGVTFDNQGNVIDSKIFKDILSYQNVLIASVAFNSIMISYDSGSTWSSFSEGLMTDWTFSGIAIKGSNIWALRDFFGNAYLRPLSNITDLEDENIISPAEFSLDQNYPNPFNPSTSIQYAIGSRQFVTLKVYDILGNEIAELVNEEKVAGKYEVNFNASALASGVYIYKIQAGSFINSKKMILLK